MVDDLVDNFSDEISPSFFLTVPSNLCIQVLCLRADLLCLQHSGSDGVHVLANQNTSESGFIHHSSLVVRNDISIVFSFPLLSEFARSIFYLASVPRTNGYQLFERGISGV